MTLAQFRKATKQELRKYGKTLPIDNTHNDKGKRLTFKNNNGAWSESTYDSKGYNELTYKNSSGFWRETTYDKDSNELTNKDSDGVYEILGQEVSKEVFNQITKGDK